MLAGVLEQLGLVGRGVPPAALLPFLQSHLSGVLAVKDAEPAVRLLAAVGAALRDERLPAANRDTIGNLMETALDLVTPDKVGGGGAGFLISSRSQSIPARWDPSTHLRCIDARSLPHRCCRCRQCYRSC